MTSLIAHLDCRKTRAVCRLADRRQRMMRRS
jgi:hypothetical protein